MSADERPFARAEALLSLSATAPAGRDAADRARWDRALAEAIYGRRSAIFRPLEAAAIRTTDR